jgi:hypothetical protein
MLLIILALRGADSMLVWSPPGPTLRTAACVIASARGDPGVSQQ